MEEEKCKIIALKFLKYFKWDTMKCIKGKRTNYETEYIV